MFIKHEIKSVRKEVLNYSLPSYLSHGLITDVDDMIRNDYLYSQTVDFNLHTSTI